MNPKSFSLFSLCTAFILFISIGTVSAENIFSEANYCLPQYGCMLMCPLGKSPLDFGWNSSDKNIADIDSRGFITGINQGYCIIKATDKKSGYISQCNILVTPEENVKSLYFLPHQPVAGTKSNIYAVTGKNIKKLKFIVSGQEKPVEITAYKNKSIGHKDLWSASITLSNSGNYNIQAFYSYSENWVSCPNREINVYVESKAMSNSASSNARNISEKGLEFISSCEGFAPNIMQDYKHTFFIGYGHTIRPFSVFNKNISREEALSILINDINNSYYKKILNNFLVQNNIYFNQQQFDALLSFTYNLGVGWIVNGSNLKNLILNINGENNILMGKVTSSNGLNLRCKASASSKRIKALQYGESVKILNPSKFNTSWYLVRTSDGKTGYCHGKYVKQYIKPDGKIKNLKNINFFQEDFMSLISSFLENIKILIIFIIKRPNFLYHNV